MIIFICMIVYKHIRKDTKEVFYIGIGKTKRRAFSSNNRNKHWHSIVNKIGYDIEIIYDELDREEAIKKEIQLIKYYGRADLNEGGLVNMTDGGEGGNGAILNDEHKLALLNSKLGKTYSEEHRRKISESKIGKKRKPFTDEHKRKIAEGAMGRQYSHSEETKERIRITLTGRKNPSLSERLKGKPSWNKGKTMSEETKRKMSESAKNRSNSQK